MTTIRDRIIDFRRVPAADLLPNPKNWRLHPAPQRDAMRGILEEIGYAGALLARETPDGLELLDGHLRRETTPDQVVPVLVLDVTEAEARVLLASYDPLSAMATADAAALDALLREVSVNDDELRIFLGKLAADNLALEPIDPSGEWTGMPEFSQEDKTAFQTVHVHFKDAAAVQSFAELIGQPLTEHSRTVWFPPVPIERYIDKRYSAE